MAIIKPNEMDFSGKNIIAILYGLPGVGKTTLALSSPDVLLIDTDEGMCRVNKAHRKDASICKTYEEILADIKAAEGNYKTIVIDTAGALIDYLKDWAMRNDPKASKKDGGFSLQGFGIIKQEFLRLSAELRKKFNVIFIFHASAEKVDEDIRYELVCEGSARTLVYQPADIAGFVFMQGRDRYIGFTPTNQYSAKSAYGISGLIKVQELKDGEPNDFMEKLFAKIRANLAKEVAELHPKNDAYQKAIEEGNECIAMVNNVDDANNCMAALKMINHSLTSREELANALSVRCAELGISFNRKKKVWEKG